MSNGKSGQSGRVTAIFRPVAPVIGRLGLVSRITLIGVILLIPISVLLAQVVARLQSDIAFSRGELEGVPVTSALFELARAAQELRVTELADGGAGFGQPKRSGPSPSAMAARGELDKRVRSVDTVIEGKPSLQLGERWKPLRATLQGLAGSQSKADSHALHDAVEDLGLLSIYGGETSGLLFDPDAATYFLMDLSVERLFVLSEAASSLEARVARLAAGDQTSASEISADLRGLGVLVRQATAGVQAKFDALKRAGGKVPESWSKARDAVAAFVNEAVGRQDGDGLATLAAASLDQRRRALETGSRAQSAIAAAHRDATSSHWRARSRRVYPVWSRGSRWRSPRRSAVCCWRSTWCWRSATRSGAPHVRWKRPRLRMASGDLKQAVEVDGRDEFAKIGASFESVRTRVGDVLDEMHRMAQAHEAGRSMYRSMRTVSMGVTTRWPTA
ncbi:MAG: hypothetical protein R3E48_06860 [Burkholderiaceae bacterium]